MSLVAVIGYALYGGKGMTNDDGLLRKLDLSFFCQNSDEDAKGGNGKDNGQANVVDSTKQTFLFFGDSMTEGLFYRLDDYCQANGHKLYSLTWYSATTESFSKSNVLDTYIKLYHPSYFIVCLGSNELFVKDLAQRKRYIAEILKKFGDKPYVWISPPNWKKDSGMDSLIMEAVGKKRFFNSSLLELERSSDHMHPTLNASAAWMDRIAQWISDPKSTAHAVVMDKPDRKHKHSFADYYQTNFKGFTGKDNPERHRRYYR